MSINSQKNWRKGPAKINAKTSKILNKISYFVTKGRTGTWRNLWKISKRYAIGKSKNEPIAKRIIDTTPIKIYWHINIILLNLRDL